MFLSPHACPEGKQTAALESRLTVTSLLRIHRGSNLRRDVPSITFLQSEWCDYLVYPFVNLEVPY